MNKKVLVAFVIMLIGSFVSGYFGPWWAPAVFIVITAILLGMSVKQSILISGLTLAIVFLAMATWLRSQDHSGILNKTGKLFMSDTPAVLFMATVMIGLITGMLSGWLGSEMGKLFRK